MTDPLIRIIKNLCMIVIMLSVLIFYFCCFYQSLLYFYYSFRDMLGIDKPQVHPFPDENDKSEKAEVIRNRQRAIDKRWDRLYNNSLVPLAFSPILAGILAGICEIFMSIDLEKGYFILMSVYIATYLRGMYRRYCYDKNVYQKILEANIVFSKMCFIPVGFVISLFSFYINFEGWHIDRTWSLTAEAFAWLAESIEGTSLINDITGFFKIILINFLMILILAIFSMAAEYYVMKVLLYRLNYELEYLEIKNYASVFRKQKRRFAKGYLDENMESEIEKIDSNKNISDSESKF